MLNYKTEIHEELIEISSKEKKEKKKTDICLMWIVKQQFGHSAYQIPFAATSFATSKNSHKLKKPLIKTNCLYSISKNEQFLLVKKKTDYRGKRTKKD